MRVEELKTEAKNELEKRIKVGEEFGCLYIDPLSPDFNPCERSSLGCYAAVNILTELQYLERGLIYGFKRVDNVILYSACSSPAVKDAVGKVNRYYTVRQVIVHEMAGGVL